MIMTVEQAAEVLHIAPKTCRALARRGLIPAAKIGKHWRFDQKQLEDFIAQRAAEKQAPVCATPPRKILEPELAAEYAGRIMLGYTPAPIGASSVTRSAIRNERVRRATPVWADLAAIKIFYREARWLTRRTQLRHHVDHIVPIEGGTVCGLHVQHNLRIITAVSNVRRPRRWDPQAPLP